MIFPNSYDPYGSLEAEEINDEVIGENHEHEHDTDTVDVGSTEAYTEEKEPSKDSVSHHLENQKKNGSITATVVTVIGLTYFRTSQ